VAVAGGRGGFLVTWDNEPGRIRAARVTVAGDRLVAAPTVTLVERPVTRVMSGPVVAWHGAGFWVLWGRVGRPGRRLRHAAVARGQPLDPTPLQLADGAGEPVLLADGAQVLAAWAAAAAGSVEVRLARLRPDATVLGGAVVLTIPGVRPVAPSLAASGGDFLVTGAAIDAAGAQRLRAARISPDGGLLDPGGFDVVAPAGTAAGGPTAVWHQGGYTVMWASATMQGNRSVPQIGASRITDGKMVATGPFDLSRAGQMPFLTPGPRPFVFWSEAGWWTTRGCWWACTCARCRPTRRDRCWSPMGSTARPSRW
jgi:hypothetical protein